MRKLKQVEVTTQKEVIEKITCDGCGTSGGYGGAKLPYLWNDDGDDFETVEVSGQLIINGEYTKYDFDVCPTCFKDKIVPLLDGKGVDDRIERIRKHIESMKKNAQEAVDSLYKKHREAVLNGDLSGQHIETMRIKNGAISAYDMILGLIRDMG